MHKIAMLGTGLIGRFYAMSLQNFRGKDEIKVVCSNKLENAKKFAEEFGIPRWTGWLFPVGDEVGSLGYVAMFMDMFNSMDKGSAPMETFYDGYIVNTIIAAAYKAAKSKKWEPVEVTEWRGRAVNQDNAGLKDYDERYFLIKEEKMPDGKLKVILKDKQTGKISQIIHQVLWR